MSIRQLDFEDDADDDEGESDAESESESEPETDSGADPAKDGRPESGKKGADGSDSEDDDHFEDALEKLNIEDGTDPQHVASSPAPVSVCA